MKKVSFAFLATFFSSGCYLLIAHLFAHPICLFSSRLSGTELGRLSIRQLATATLLYSVANTAIHLASDEKRFDELLSPQFDAKSSFYIFINRPHNLFVEVTLGVGLYLLMSLSVSEDLHLFDWISLALMQILAATAFVFSFLLAFRHQAFLIANVALLAS